MIKRTKYRKNTHFLSSDTLQFSKGLEMYLLNNKTIFLLVEMASHPKIRIYDKKRIRPKLKLDAPSIFCIKLPTINKKANKNGIIDDTNKTTYENIFLGLLYSKGLTNKKHGKRYIFRIFDSL